MTNKSAPTVQTQSGALAGKWESDNQIAVFKGIPYAQAPVGPLRWKPPQPVAPWTGTRDATKHGSIAWQYFGAFELFVPALLDGQGWNVLKRTAAKLLLKIAPKEKQSEDCLFLNVRTPALDPAAKLPVMVWIHGGDHQFGSGSDPIYVTNKFSRRGVVYVSINYRLGLMGFFAHPQLSEESAEGVSGNYGLLDQILALQWVQENIANFGGDPNNVTIFGESAGGESVAHLMVSPRSRGLFQRAIMQSPANSGQMRHLKEPFLDYPSGEEQGVQFANSLQIGGDDAIGQLRDRAAADLYAQVNGGNLHGACFPQIDGHLLPQSPFAAFHEGKQVDVPLLIGTNADEGSPLHQLFPNPLIEYSTRSAAPDRLPDYVAEAFPQEIERLLQLYPQLDRREPGAERAFFGDSMFGSKARFLADAVVAAGQPTYLYHFTRVPPNPKQTVGTYHAADLAFVFGTPSPILPFNEAEKHLSSKMIDYWTNFATAGDPNGDPNDNALPAWSQFEPTQPLWMVLDPARCGMEEVDRDEKFRLLNQRTLRQIELMQAQRA